MNYISLGKVSTHYNIPLLLQTVGGRLYDFIGVTTGNPNFHSCDSSLYSLTNDVVAVRSSLKRKSWCRDPIICNFRTELLLFCILCGPDANTQRKFSFCTFTVINMGMTFLSTEIQWHDDEIKKTHLQNHITLHKSLNHVPTKISNYVCMYFSFFISKLYLYSKLFSLPVTQNDLTT